MSNCACDRSPTAAAAQVPTNLCSRRERHSASATSSHRYVVGGHYSGPIMCAAISASLQLNVCSSPRASGHVCTCRAPLPVAARLAAAACVPTSSCVMLRSHRDRVILERLNAADTSLSPPFAKEGLRVACILPSALGADLGHVSRFQASPGGGHRRPDTLFTLPRSCRGRSRRANQGRDSCLRLGLTERFFI